MAQTEYLPQSDENTFHLAELLLNAYMIDSTSDSYAQQKKIINLFLSSELKQKQKIIKPVLDYIDHIISISEDELFSDKYPIGLEGLLDLKANINELICSRELTSPGKEGFIQAFALPVILYTKQACKLDSNLPAGLFGNILDVFNKSEFASHCEIIAAHQKLLSHNQLKQADYAKISTLLKDIENSSATVSWVKFPCAKIEVQEANLHLRYFIFICKAKAFIDPEELDEPNELGLGLSALFEDTFNDIEFCTPGVVQVALNGPAHGADLYAHLAFSTTVTTTVAGLFKDFDTSQIANQLYSEINVDIARQESLLVLKNKKTNQQESIDLSDLIVCYLDDQIQAFVTVQNTIISVIRAFLNKDFNLSELQNTKLTIKYSDGSSHQQLLSFTELISDPPDIQKIDSQRLH